MTKTPKFQRAGRASAKSYKDEAGDVVVRINLMKAGAVYAKGNLMKSLRVGNARVSEVFAAIERALFV